MKQKISWIDYTNIKTILNFKEIIKITDIMRKTGKTANCVRRMLMLLEDNGIMTSVVSGRERHFRLTKKGKLLQKEFSKFTVVLQEI